jgi:hypothetical protein
MDNRAVELEVDGVYEASAPVDPITWGEFHGQYRTWEDSFGAEELPTDWRNWHTGYYDEDGSTLTPIGEVVGGVREPA